MDVELINKHWNEFVAYMREDTKLSIQWTNINGSKWEDVDYFSWEDVECAGGTITAIVINDEYVEFRKALAEGKTVQYKHYSDELFSDLENFPFKDGYDYRIKPDEAFKVGDYVIALSWVDKTPTQIIKIEDGLLYNSPVSAIDINEAKLWTLEEADDDEWVHVWSNNATSYRTMRLKEVSRKRDNIVPAIGQTPEQLGLEK